MNLSFKYYRLQQIDSQLDKARTRLSEIEAILADTAELDRATQALEDAQNLLEAHKRDLKWAEQETATQRGKIRESERQLYGGKITNPKELQDLQLEVEALKRHLSVLEDRQLEAMISMEDAQSDTGASEAAWTSIQGQAVERKAALRGEETTIEAEVIRLDEERNAASISLEPSELEQYERLRRTKNGVAVARVTEGTCAACGSTLSAAVIQSSQSPNAITRCSTCGRILYGG